MKVLSRSWVVSVSLSTLTVLAVGCGPSDGDGGTGTGGATSSGGHVGTGGSGTGGSTGSGGAGSGGSASGGAVGSGGAASGSGGTTGSGGNGSGGSGSGGTTGTGGGSGGNGSGGGGAPGGNHGMASGGGRGGGAGGTGGAAGAMGGGGRGGAPAGGSGGAGAFNPCPTNGDPCKILPLGDSITFGYGYEGGYRLELYKKILAANQKITYVGTQMNGPQNLPGTSTPFQQKHEGHSGFTIQQLTSSVIKNDVQFSPHVILLHIGTNNMYSDGDGNAAPGLLQTLVDAITGMFPSSLLVVGKIVPYPGGGNRVNSYNATIPSLVSSRASMGKHIIMADLNAGFSTSTMLQGDNLHPNQSGYDWMGDTWYSVISNLLPR